MIASRSAPVPAAAAAFASLVCASLGELPFKISQLKNGCWNSANLARPDLQQRASLLPESQSQAVSFKQCHHFGAVHHH